MNKKNTWFPSGLTFYNVSLLIYQFNFIFTNADKKMKRNSNTKKKKCWTVDKRSGENSSTSRQKKMRENCVESAVNCSFWCGVKTIWRMSLLHFNCIHGIAVIYAENMVLTSLWIETSTTSQPHFDCSNVIHHVYRSLYSWIDDEGEKKKRNNEKVQVMQNSNQWIMLP